MATLAPSRRAFLQSSGLVLGLALPAGGKAMAAAVPDAPFTPNAFVRVTPDNLVTVIIKHIEMGQGPSTGLATILADEMDVDWSQIRVEFAPANDPLFKNVFFGTMGTGGSSAIANSWELLRNAEGERSHYRDGLLNAVHTIRTHEAAPRLAVDHAKGFKLFDPRTISSIEADGNCTLLHFTDGSRYLDTRTMKVYEDMLDPLQFLRVHRSHIVNTEQIREYVRDDGHWAVMRDGERVPIARERLKAFLDAVRGPE
jgi:hypothetical protein